MFRFNLKSEVVPVVEPLPPSRYNAMLLFHEDKLERVFQKREHYLLVTGGTGVGKSTFVEAWLHRLNMVATTAGRYLVAIRLSVPNNTSTQLNRLSGKLELRRSITSKIESWGIEFEPKLDTPAIKLGLGKITVKGNVPKPSGDIPLDQQARNIRDQLINLATKKKMPLLGKNPIVAVTIERLHHIDLLRDLREMFDANLALPEKNRIFYLISGGLNLHFQWWQQKKKANAALTEFSDLYLPYVWSLANFCETVIDRKTVSDAKLVHKFTKYLVVKSSGELREIWTNLDQSRNDGVDETHLERYARFYDLLMRDDRLIHDLAVEMSLNFPEQETKDRLQWCICVFLNWFLQRWDGENDLIQDSELSAILEKFAGMLESPNRERLRDRILEHLVEKGYLRKFRGEYHLPNVECPRCKSKDHKATSGFCVRCGTQLPGREPKPSGRICPSCGHVNRRRARFCSKCRASIGLVPLVPTQHIPITSGPLQPGTILAARYRVLRLLGKGGMGATYLAEDERLFSKQCAVKEMLSDYTNTADIQQARQQFELEAQVLTSINHPNAVRITDFFNEGGRYYLVMEFIEGETLESILRHASKPLPLRDVVHWVSQVCDVLQYLHTRTPPVIFRDVKPSNIMVTIESQVKLIDFGIARLFKPGQSKDTAAFGSTGFAPPEQYGLGQTDTRSDIYALGVTLHQLLTDFDPAVSTFNLPAPHSLNPDIPEAIEQVILKATQISKTDRFQSCVEMKQAILQAMESANG